MALATAFNLCKPTLYQSSSGTPRPDTLPKIACTSNPENFQNGQEAAASNVQRVFVENEVLKSGSVSDNARVLLKLSCRYKTTQLYRRRLS